MPHNNQEKEQWMPKREKITKEDIGVLKGLVRKNIQIIKKYSTQSGSDKEGNK